MNSAREPESLNHLFFKVQKAEYRTLADRCAEYREVSSCFVSSVNTNLSVAVLALQS